jgi:hypothetical protein
MRHTLVFGLTLFVFAVAAGADTPIPQDTARMEKRRRERLEWNRRTFQGAYDKVGKKDPRWDEPARKAMDQAARMFSKEVDPEITYSDLHQPARAAIDAGCDDPLLVFLYNRSLVGPNYPGDEEATRRMKAMAKALAASRYPAFRRAITLELAGTYALSAKEPSEASRKEAERDFDAALALLPESVANDERNEFWEDQWLDTLNHLLKGYRLLGVAATAAYDRVDAGLAKLPELKVLRLQFRGDFWTMYGWEARTNAIAPLVPAGGFEALEKRLVVAQKALDEAWQLRPDDARTAVDLLDIEKTVGGDRATMELWFDRAMKADGDRYGACFTKLDWLDPKWHGSVEEMLAFGRACRATKNWRAGITLLAVEAHFHHAITLEQEERVKYLGSPAVWSEIKSVFDEYLKHHPTSDVARSKYAAIAVLASKYPAAHAQFQALGDRLTTWSAFPSIPLEELKRFRDNAARITAEKLGGNNAARGPVGWIGFHARNNGGEWTVKVPVRPERRQEAGILGAKARNVFTCTDDGITYTVRVQLVPPAARAGGAEAVLDAARDAIAKEHGGQVRDKHPALLSELPAQEYLIDAPALRPAVLRVRSGLIGDRLHELSVSASEADVSGAAAIKFLESFKFQQ